MGRDEQEGRGGEVGATYFGIGAGNKLVCCTQRKRGQLEFSSDRTPEYLSTEAEGPAAHQRHKVMM